MSATSARANFRLRANVATIWAQLRTLYWRVLGMEIGAGTALPRIHVTWPHQVSLGKDCIFERDIFFKYDGVWAPGPSIFIHDGVFVGSDCEFNARRRIEIGADCLIASGCKFIDHDHGAARRDLPMRQQPPGPEAEIILAEDVWLGVNVVVLKGVHIGRGAIVGAGAVVTKNIPPYEIWAGVPAQKIGERPGP
jgi:acetyltransferase-like isoleucine patch superfamily enzyme